MRVAVTGTPGTGKTSATALLETGSDRSGSAAATELPVVHANELIREEGLDAGVDAERGGSLVVDIGALEALLDDRYPDGAIVEAHLAHRLDADRVIVLRCRPDELERRLRERGEPDPTVAENVESEAIDLVLAEAVERHGRDRVYEIDTTDQSPGEVAAAIGAVLTGEREPSAGTVDFTDYLDPVGETTVPSAMGGDSGEVTDR